MNQTIEDSHSIHSENIPEYSRRTAMQNSSEYRIADPRRKSPVRAALCSLVPGLGQIYVGYYQRGFIFVGVFGGAMSLLAANIFNGIEPLFAIFLPFFWLFNLIDAYRRAVLYNMALDGLENIELPDDIKVQSLGGSYAGGIVLLVLSAAALSNTLFGLSLQWLESWWPVAPLLFGAYLVYQAYREQKKD